MIVYGEDKNDAAQGPHIYQVVLHCCLEAEKGKDLLAEWRVVLAEFNPNATSSTFTWYLG
jgi:hypothetical protein